MENGRTDTAGPSMHPIPRRSRDAHPDHTGQARPRPTPNHGNSPNKREPRPARGPARNPAGDRAVALTGTLAAPRADAAQPPPGPRTYKVTADLDGRVGAVNRPSAIAAVDFLLEGQRVPIECQMYGDRAYGSKLWDLVTSRRRTLYVPDRFIQTHTNGRAPEIRRCTDQDRTDTIPH
jgi:hypothetical protein